MYPDLSLKENITHGTKEQPIRAMHFTTGKSTPYPDHFFVSRHWHSYIEILHIVKGSYLFEINLRFLLRRRMGSYIHRSLSYTDS